MKTEKVTQGYLRFISENPRFLLYGFLLTFFSCFGQTYYISIFSSEIRSIFSLSHGDYGLIYAIATIGSATTLVWVGKFIDKMDLRSYTIFVLLGLSVACLLFSFISSIILLTISLFLLRLFGQGLMMHTSVTSMGRYFNETRGKAVSLVSFGNPLGQGMLVSLAIFLLSYLDWQTIWIASSIATILIVSPIILLLLGNHPVRKRKTLSKNTTSINTVNSWTRKEVLRDIRFYLILPLMLAPSYITTGFFFHMSHLVDTKGWDLNVFTQTFYMYVVSSLLTALITGNVTDKFGAKKILPLSLIPQCVAMLILAVTNQPIAQILYMFTSGMTVGIRVTIGGAIWPEIYGVNNLGGIRALATFFMVLSTAIAPVSMGYLIDAGITMEMIALGCFIYMTFSSIAAWFGVRIKSNTHK